MTSNKINGSYLIKSSNIGSYTFTGNSRTAGFVSESAIYPSWKELSNSQEEGTIELLTKNILHVKSIKVCTPGGEGLRCLLPIMVKLFYFLPGNVPQFLNDGPLFELTRYNEKQSIDIRLEPYKITDVQRYSIGIKSTICPIDDYNIQDAYIGKDVSFNIELDIDTAGIYRNGTII